MHLRKSHGKALQKHMYSGLEMLSGFQTTEAILEVKS